MVNTIDASGFHRVRFQDLRVEVAELYKGVFGSDIKTDSQSGFGQFITSQTSAEDEQAATVGALISMLDPLAAQGQFLDNTASSMGKKRVTATKSTVELELFNDTGIDADVLAGFRSSTPTGSATFETTEDYIVTAGTSLVVPVVSVTAGDFVTPADSVTNIRTPVLGVSRTNNPADAVAGRFRESDPILRSRMIANAAQAGTSITGLYSALSNIDGVTDLRVYENKTDLIGGAPSFVANQPPHSIFPVIEGGADSEIVEALITQGVAGGINYTEPTDIPSANITSGVFIDPINGQSHTAHYARNVDIRSYCVVNISVDDIVFPDTGEESIKTSIAEWIIQNQDVGEDLKAFELYGPISDSANGIAAIVSVFVGDTTPPVNPVLSIDKWEKATLLAADILVNRV